VGSGQHKFVVNKTTESLSNLNSTLSETDTLSEDREKSRSKSGSSRKKKGLFGHHSSDSSPSVSKNRSSNAEIEDKHPEFEVTYDMMLGIRTVIGMAYNHPPKEIGKEDFEHVGKYSFPKAGSTKTPAHKGRDFRFKDYHPEVFRRIRERFGIEAMEYTMTVTNNHYLEFISNSKSGQFFFYTHNKQFMIKTMSKEECKFIRKILPAYYQVGLLFRFCCSLAFCSM
jgi:1-phosphatidylinositol-4-phosphate 5-kinase